MLNVLFPMSGKSKFFNSTEYPYPKPLIEIFGKSMIEIVINNYKQIKDDLRFTFIVNEDDCKKFHLDNTLELLTEGKSHIIRLKKNTKGAACSALMAIEQINNNTPLIIANSDQIIEDDLNKVIEFFSKQKADAGVICFESIHPRWSYVKTTDGRIVETAEKNPISKNAIAGFYFYKHGSDFVRSAMKSIVKDAHIEGQFFIAPTMNELVLENKKLIVYQLDNDQFHTLYTPQKIKEYEAKKSTAAS